MLLTIEKVLILKTVSIFAETPEEILVEVAAILEEVDVQAGETILHKDDVGRCMYIIVDGRVRIHHGDQIIAYLEARDIFGELAVLDAEPRSASVTAEVDTHLFRLDQDALYELMADRFEVARGIIRMLCRRDTTPRADGQCRGCITAMQRQCYLCTSSALAHQLVVFPCG